MYCLLNFPRLVPPMTGLTLEPPMISLTLWIVAFLGTSSYYAPERHSCHTCSASRLYESEVLVRWQLVQVAAHFHILL